MTFSDLVTAGLDRVAARESHLPYAIDRVFLFYLAGDINLPELRSSLDAIQVELDGLETVRTALKAAGEVAHLLPML